jgi:hypothetical protein
MIRRGPTMRVREAGLHARTAPFFLNIFVVLLGLLALTTQSLVVQTHVHYSAVSSGAKTAILSIPGQDGGSIGTDGNSGPAGKSDTGSDQSNCPLCQAFANFSQFTHSVALFSVPFLTGRTIYLAVHEAVPSFAAVSHSWRGRAPPR